MRPLFFRGRQVNLEGLRDIEEIFTWVDRGGLGRAGNPPRIGPKSSLSGSAVLSWAQTAGRKRLVFRYVKPEGDLNEVHGVRTPGGVGKGENSTLRLT